MILGVMSEFGPTCENCDRSRCKNGTNRGNGDCNALASSYPYDHVLDDIGGQRLGNLEMEETEYLGSNQHESEDENGELKVLPGGARNVSRKASELVAYLQRLLLP